MKLTRSPWLVVGLLWFVACFNWTARGMITTMHNSVVSAIPMTEAQFGLLTSAFAWVYGVLSPFAGFLSDRFSRSRVIGISLVAWSTATFLTAYAANLPQLIAMRALMGVSEACYLPASLALITDYHRGGTRSFAVGVHMTGIGVGSALAGLGGLLAEKHAWGYPFEVVGLAGIAYGGVLFCLLRDAPRESHRPAVPEAPEAPRINFFRAMASMLSRGSFLLVVAFYILSGIVGWVIFGWMPTYIQERFHLSQGAAGLSATSYLNLAYLPGLLIGGYWADRWARRSARATILVPVIGYLIAAPGIFLALRIGVLPVAMCGLALYGAACGISDANMMPILCVISDPRYRATGYGILNAVGTISGGLAIYATGALRDLHYDLGRILAFSAIAVLACPLLLYLIKPPAKAAPAAP